MKLRGWAVGISAAAFAATPAHAGDKVLFGPPPSWVVAHPAGAEPSQAGDLPIEFLQIDSQVHYEGATETTYSLVRLKFLTPQGLQAGNLSYSWEPDKGDLTVNRVVIHRGDQTIDVLGAGQTFTVLRREQGLEQATIDGALTANMFPEGLQVGDVLETAITITRTDPVVGEHAETRVGPLNFPAGQIDLSVQWPAGRPMTLAATPDLPQWMRTKANGFETATITLHDIKPIVPPSDAPDRFGVVRMAEASDYRSWSEVAAINLPLYAKASAIPADGPLRAEVEKIRAAGKDPVARAEAALQLVQNRIRYVALEMGVGGLSPADAATTWSRRYGDCKAKTALLLGLLRELGIDAEPVVVNASGGDYINDRLPAIGLFNHILVRATVAGKSYWLDGTRTGDTSLSRLKIPNFGWGLPIHKSVAGLVRMLPPPLDEPESDLAIELDATQGIHSPVPARLELTLRGDDAVGTNQVLTSLAGNAHDEALRKYWRNRFDFIDPKTFDVSFNQSKAELRLTMQGTATLEWNDGWYETDETGVGYRADFSRAPGPKHDVPFVVDYPMFNRTRETILLPPTFTGKVSSDKTEVDETVGGIEYHRHAALTGNKFVIERTARSLLPEIAYKDAVAAQKRLRDLNDQSVFLKIPAGYRPTATDLAALAGTKSDDPAELIEQGEALERGGKYDDAAAKFARATELDPKNADAWAGLGYSQSQKGNVEAALVSIGRAAVLDPKNLVMLNTRGLIAGGHRDFQAALDDFDTVLKIDPNNSFAKTHRLGALASLGRKADALASANAIIASDPQQVEAYAAKAGILLMSGDRVAARDAVNSMLEAAPDDPGARAVAAELYNQLGYPEKARPLIEQASDAPPNAFILLQKSHLRSPSDFDGKLTDLNEALRLQPDFVPALAERAAVYEAKGQKDAALADYDAVLRLSPGASGVVGQRARLLSSMGKRDEALKAIDKAIAADPKALNLYLQKANMLRDLGRKEQSLAVAADMVAAAPDETYAHVAAAKIYDAFGEREKALSEIDRALAIAPQAYIYVNRAMVLPADDYDGRIADADKALQLEPDMPDAVNLKANMLMHKGDWAAAAELYSKMLVKQPNDPGYLNARGIAWWRAGRHDEAERDFTAAHEQAKDAMQLNNICYEKAIAGVDLERALQECDESLRLAPDSPPTLDSRATVYLQMGRYKEAAADYDRALAAVPTMAPSLLGRAIAKLHLGDAAGAHADAAAARKASSTIVESMRTRGVAVPLELAT